MQQPLSSNYCQLTSCSSLALPGWYGIMRGLLQRAGYLKISHPKVKSSHLYLYSAFNNTNGDKATAQYQNGKIVSIM